MQISFSSTANVDVCSCQYSSNRTLAFLNSEGFGKFELIRAECHRKPALNSYSITFIQLFVWIMAWWNSKRIAADKSKNDSHFEIFDSLTRSYTAHPPPRVCSHSCSRTSRTEHTVHSFTPFSEEGTKWITLHYHLWAAWHSAFPFSFRSPPSHSFICVGSEIDYLSYRNINTIFHANYKWKMLEYLE